ncbi:hypothetical protein BJV78DRAFT_56544 [Lactifluus subvellereus]|nr:hypothetical protein BJV78DRAFT_56544 [Lactifluus subvellereus]
MSTRSPRSQEIDIETSVTPAVKDLRNLFEQKARAFPQNLNGSLRPGDSSPLLGPSKSPRQSPRHSPGPRSSPMPFDDPIESPTPLKPPPPDQGSLRKRPPPPPPSRGQKQQLGSPSSSTSPSLRETPEKGNALGNGSPSSIKQRLAARPPPPVPELRLDQADDVDPSSETNSTVDEPSSSHGGATDAGQTRISVKA